MNTQINELIKKVNQSSNDPLKNDDASQKLAHEIVLKLLERSDIAIGLGSGDLVEKIATELVKKVEEVLARKLKIVVTRKWMYNYFRKSGVLAFIYDHKKDLSRIDCFFETINIVCKVDKNEPPLCIKTDEQSQHSWALAMRSKCVLLFRSGNGIHSESMRGIPMDLENSSAGFTLLKTWFVLYGGYMNLRSNINPKSDRLHVEWIPPKFWTTRDQHKVYWKWKNLRTVLDKTPEVYHYYPFMDHCVSGVLSHNLFIGKNFHLMEPLKNSAPDFRQLVDRMNSF